MFTSNNPLKTYVDIDNNISGADFEKKWFESVITLLKKIQAGEFDAVMTHKKLLEISEGLQWIQENLNEKLSSQHRTLLKSIYSTSIQIMNGAIQTRNTEYLGIVIACLETVVQPYYRKSDTGDK
jgi:endonuclease/exonuclease/phosphatase (EEP) superfamily protein YafD